MGIDSNTKKFSKRSFLKYAGSLTGAAGTVSASIKAGGVFALFQALFRAPNAEAQTWKKIGSPGPATNTWQKLKLESELRYPYTQIEVGNNYCIALRADGVVFATGRNTYGNLGDNTTVNKSTYVSSI